MLQVLLFYRRRTPLVPKETNTNTHTHVLSFCPVKSRVVHAYVCYVRVFLLFITWGPTDGLECVWMGVWMGVIMSCFSQVVLDTRLWLRTQVAQATRDMSTLMQVCCEAAETHMDVLMAG